MTKKPLTVNMEKERHLVETPAKYSGDGFVVFLTVKLSSALHWLST